MKRTVEAITAVIGVMLPLIAGCTKLEAPSQMAMFRANLQHTGVYDTRAVHVLSELKWKFKTEGQFKLFPNHSRWSSLFRKQGWLSVYGMMNPLFM
jgi:hypothetical protein